MDSCLSYADKDQILKPAEKKAPKYGYGVNGRRQWSFFRIRSMSCSHHFSVLGTASFRLDADHPSSCCNSSKKEQEEGRQAGMSRIICAGHGGTVSGAGCARSGEDRTGSKEHISNGFNPFSFLLLFFFHRLELSEVLFCFYLHIPPLALSSFRFLQLPSPLR